MADEQIVTSIVAKADLSSLVTEVHKATASLQKLQQDLQSAGKTVASQVKVINNSFGETLRSTGQFASHFVTLNSDVEKFGRGLDSGRLKLRDYYAAFNQHAKQSGGLIKDLAKQQVMLQNAVMQPLGRNAQGLMQYNVHIPRGLDLVKNKTNLARMELQIMNRAINEGATALINWGKNTQWAGRQLTVGLTVPIAGFGAAAAKAFREADQELTRLTKVYGDVGGATAEELSKVRKEIVQTSKELSSAMGVNFKDTISLAADIAATGKTGNELLGSLKETTRLAVLGEVDRQEAMKATLAIQSAFKQNTDELSKSINFLNAVENQTSTTLNDLVEAIPKAGPVIKGLGGSVQDLALYLTAMREGGVSASEGANALKSALASLINPTDVAVAKFQGFGIDILGIVNQNAGNVTQTLFALQDALDTLDPLQKQQAIEQLFGKFQFSRLNALFENLGKQGSQTLQVLDLMKASSAELEAVASRELTAVTESASGRYKRAIEGLRAELSVVGEDFLELGTKFINVVTKLLKFLNNLPEPVKKLITAFGGLTAVAGPLIMLTGVLANFAGYLLKGGANLKALLSGSKGWKMLTPEIVAAEYAARSLEETFYSDAQAAKVLEQALRNLIDEFNVLNSAVTSGNISVKPAVTTIGNNLIMPGTAGREVDPTHRLVGESDTRAFSHINPRKSGYAGQLFGVVPGALPVNRKLGATPQIYMTERLPNIEGLTSVGGVSTGIVAQEAAKFHALMATLGMQTEAEVAELKKVIGLGGTISSDLLNTYDDLLPITSKFAQKAAAESQLIVAELRAAKITVEEAKVRIMTLNAQIESEMSAEVAAFAATRGRSIDFTKAPLMNQPITDTMGHYTLRDLFKRENNRQVMEEFGRLRGIRTFGAPYSMEVTRIPKFNRGGGVFYNNGDQVPGPNINADVVPAMLTPGEFVIRRGIAQQDPDGMRALNEGRAVVVPLFNSGGRIPRVQYANRGLAITAAMRSAGTAQTAHRYGLAERFAQRSRVSPYEASFYYNPAKGRQEDRAHSFFSVREMASRGASPTVGYFGHASVNKYNRLQNRLHKRLGTRDVNPVTDFTAQNETLPSIFRQAGAGDWFDKNGFIGDGVLDRGKISAYLDHVEQYASTRRWDSRNFGPLPMGFLGLDDTLSIRELREYVDYLMSGNVTKINKGGIILNDAAALMSARGLSEDEALDEAERIYMRAMQEGDDDWSYYGRRSDITESDYPFMIRRNRGGMIPGYNGGGGISRAGLLARLGAKFKYEGKTYDGPQSLQTYRINAMDINGGKKYFGHIEGLSDKGKGALYNASLEFFNTSMIKGERINGKRLFTPLSMLTPFPTIASFAINAGKGFLPESDIKILEGMSGRGGTLGGSIGSSRQGMAKIYGRLFTANRGGMVPGYSGGGMIPGYIDGDFVEDPGFIINDRRVSQQSGMLGSTPAFASPGFSNRMGSRLKGGFSFARQNYRAGVAARAGSRFADPMQLMMRQQGIMMGGSMLGMGLMGVNPMLGTGVMAASNILPFLLPQMKKFTEGATLAARATNLIGGGIKLIGKYARFGIWAAAIGATVVAFNKWRESVAQSRREVTLLNGMTQEGAKQAGIKYNNLSESIKAVNEQLKAQRALGRANFEALAPGNIPGISMTIKDMKESKKFAKENLKEFVDTFNTISSDQVVPLAQNIKAQFIAGGMSAEEATKKIYGIIAASEKANQAVNVLASSGFTLIYDKASAAEFMVKNLVKNLGEFTRSKDFGNSFSNTLTVIDGIRKGLVGSKDETGQIITQTDALAQAMEKIEAINGSDKEIGAAKLAQLKQSQPELAAILNSTDTIAGAYAKWQVAISGARVNLQKMSSEQAIMMAKFDAAMITTMTNLAKEGGSTSTFGKIGSKMKELNKIANTVSTAAQRAAQKTQEQYREEIKLIDEKIRKIKEEADEKIKALKRVQDKESYQLELQKLQLEYQDATARGDMAAAARAQIAIQQLQKEKQFSDAINAINEETDRKVKREEEKKRKLQDAMDAKQASFQNQQMKAQDAAAARDELAKKQAEYETLTRALAYAQAMPADTAKQNARRQEAIQSATGNLASFTNEVRTLATTGKAIQQKAFAEAFKDILSSPAVVSTLLGDVKGSTYTAGPLVSSVGAAQKDVDMVRREAEMITGGKKLSDLYKIIKDQGIDGSKKNQYNKSNPLSVAGNYAVETSGKKKGTLTESSEDQIIDLFGLKNNDFFTYGGKLYRVNISGSSKQAILQKAAGGMITGPGSGTSDSIPAMLSNGEYVINAAAVKNIGVPMLDRINGMAKGGLATRFDIPKYGTGGRIMYGEGGEARSSNALYNINVTLNGSNMNPDDVAKAISREMKLREAASGIGRRY